MHDYDPEMPSNSISEDLFFFKNFPGESTTLTLACCTCWLCFAQKLVFMTNHHSYSLYTQLCSWPDQWKIASYDPDTWSASSLRFPFPLAFCHIIVYWFKTVHTIPPLYHLATAHVKNSIVLLLHCKRTALPGTGVEFIN